jgi:NADH-quinone oxidoreductase subunit N
MATGLWFLRKRQFLISFLTAGFCFLLVIAAWLVPLNQLIKVGPLVFEINDRLVILGRILFLGEEQRPLLFFFFTLSALWFLGAAFLKLNRNFIPVGLGITALVIAALAVRPFLFVALIIEVAVLMSIPVLIESGKVWGQGILRYLIFQTLAVPFILFAGWTAVGVDANPANEALLFQTVVLLGLGFALWLGVFPFYTWIPLLTGELHPYVSTFVLNLLSILVIFLCLNFLNSYAWLREYQFLLQMIRVAGILMVVTSGVWAAFQKDLGRLSGYVMIMSNGLALTAISLGNHTGYEILVTSFLPRMVGFGLWSFALSVFLEKGVGLTFEGVRGTFYRLPFASAAMVIGFFSLAGLPLLAGFPVQQALVELVSSQSLISAVWILVGMMGLLLSGFRALAALVGVEKQSWKIGESRAQMVILLAGIFMLFLIGGLPGWFLGNFSDLLQSFTFL